jgi:transcriptional regulator with XRE-family HTH domain
MSTDAGSTSAGSTAAGTDVGSTDVGSTDVGSRAADLGRRISDQRTRAGQSIEQTAAQAGMAPEYLRYLESSPSPNPSPAAMTRLAGALGVPASSLSGAGQAAPPGQPGAASHPVLTELTAAQCRTYLAAGGVGRVVFDEPDRGPVAVPVNYQMDGDDVIFRTSASGTIAEALHHGRVSFDVDHLDDALAEGWSVLLTGTARLVTEEAELKRLADLGIEPWPGGDRDSYIRLIADQVTGRRIRASAEG